ncbi:zona pellucida sperm-binding protein 2-like isoform X7 [Xiphias gladius]|uniref:zona pellucida sperm-binding protein 2-like isoform X7 n=1 Tax=Xiphias gladius TaxID=8245 RepID=UPI001A99066C|nr:zona pellucida sperm-binding protein 2-like isoform X7 [Xiphias gladius]
MNYHCAKRCLISLVFALVAQRCWCFSTVKMRTPEQRPQLALPRVICSPRRIKAVFGPLVKNNLLVRDISGATISVPQSQGPCGVRMGREKNQSLSFFSRYDSCYAQIEGSKVVIPLQVQLRGEDQWFRVNISCPLIKRYSERTPLIPTLTATDTDLPITPGSLIVKDQPQCFPVVTTPDTAVFKIGVMDCGAKMKVDGDVLIYEVEVEELNTESKSKHSAFSLQVLCEYSAKDLKRAADLRSLYAVINPPPVVALGTIRVQMRIATDASFTSFFPEDQLPLNLPLREAAYVEVSIAQPYPDHTLSLRVRDCFAYPASRHSVWTLLYDGCPNPLDNTRSSVPVDNQGKTSSHSQVRRFDVKTFAFLDPHTGHPSVEEMYFYCWVEICTDDVDCAQSCAIISSEGERQRRETMTESSQVHLVSLGPLLLGQNNTELEDNPCVKQNIMFQVTVYTLSGVGAALLLILLFTVWSSITKCQKTEMRQACDPQVDESSGWLPHCGDGPWHPCALL